MMFNLKKTFLIITAGLLLFSQAQAIQLTSKLPDFTKLVEEHKKAVVNISTVQKEEKKSIKSLEDLQDLPLDELFKKFFGEQGMPMPRRSPPGRSEPNSLGSGFIISSDGYILTNAHVVNNAKEIIVKLHDRRELTADLVGQDNESDLALLKVDAKNLPTAKLGKSSELKVGEWVFAIGSPFGFEHSVTAGIVSAIGRSLRSERYVPFIQTDVAINPGNSGGPLFNLDGEVVGVNAQILSRTGGYMGLSFSIPIDLAQSVISQLKQSGKVVHGWLGVLFQPVTRELADAYELDNVEGALVADVIKDSPAQDAGMMVGDIVLSFDEVNIYDANKLPHIVGRTPAGKSVKVMVLRDGKTRNLTVKIGELPEKFKSEFKKTETQSEDKYDKLGLMLKDLTKEEQKEHKLDYGAMISQVKFGSVAGHSDLRKGDIILMLGRDQVKDSESFSSLLETYKPGDSLAILLKRGDGRRFIAMKMPEEEKEEN